MNISMRSSCSVPLPHVRQPTQGDGYMCVARDLLQGVEVLSTAQNVSPRSCALIAAHALECALKAFLWRKGKNNSEHDLVALWDLAYRESCLNIPQVPPDWVRILSEGHGPDYVFRYQTGKGATKKEVPVFNIMQTPALIPMANELKILIEKVERSGLD